MFRADVAFPGKSILKLTTMVVLNQRYYSIDSRFKKPLRSPIKQDKSVENLLAELIGSS